MKKTDWDKRVQRAVDLANRYPGAAEVVGFYGHVLSFQKQVYEDMAFQPAASMSNGGTLRAALESAALMQWLPALLSLVQLKGPTALAREATALTQTSSQRQQETLTSYLRPGDETVAASFFARTLFQPCAEHLAETYTEQVKGFGGSVCPVCEAKPQVAVLRPEGDGGKRFLICSLCMTEWEFRRILCPVCGEEDNAQLPRYSSEDLPAVRVEACDRCHSYLKSVDLTSDGLAVPIVDEVATVSLDAWASQHGYKKVTLNLMGF